MSRWIFLVLSISIIALDFGMTATHGKPADADAVTKWRIMTEAEAREYCLRPAHMITSLTQNCSRVPTAEKPYCPMP